MEAFELRLWDGRLGRWLTVDPMGQYFSPYLGMGNNPISRVDPDGGMDGEPEDPPIEDGCVFFPTEEGYITGSSISDWQNLDYQVFNDFVKNNYCQGGDEYQRDITSALNNAFEK
ncbi:hypothetical protein NAT51_19230 [Flavobacterium amniphilum]|uniref:hypothetical protein n=1 Tax=Flavobacterium amniphilum TaxID=1834035 RepID=UPI00202A5FD3|nr:hypothetical protein [Flavobacterium amniphilum]MCL9807664.1 hypothetical protein [Flavobacterium amniphilum]